MESLSQGDSSANSSDPDDELGPAFINESGLARILGHMTGYSSTIRLGKTCRPSGVDQEVYFFCSVSLLSGGGRLGLPLLRTDEDEPQHDGEFAEHHRENPIGDPLFVLRRWSRFS
jgi:hypothetical protein